MSLMELRTDWVKLSRAVSVPAGLRRRVVLSATFTADPMVPYLGVDLTDDRKAPPIITVAPYDQIFQLCDDWRAVCGDQTPEAIVLLWRIEDFLRAEFRAFLEGASIDAALDKLDELAAAIHRLRSSFGGILLSSLPPYPHCADHHIRALRSATEGGAFHRKVVDHWITRAKEAGEVALLDLDGIQRHVGLQEAHDPRKWYLYRQPFSEVFWREAAADAAALIRTQTVAPKKCVVVDCDNTLWGGIVGEDGIEGVALGDDFPGSAFRDFHRQLLGLRAQGVMIALCSKNNEADVWDVFDRHDSMLLKREHVAAHRINWLDKPANIVSIAEELNIGLDSLVFIDDSSMEIEHVRAALPMVTCIQVPVDVSAFPTVVGAYRGFDRDRISDEDRARSDMIAQERHRRDLATNLDGDAFRKALGLVIDVFEVQGEHAARVVQLINKTNQFNLTTIRRTAAQLAELMADANTKVLAWKVADRFGDYGLVGVAILELQGDTARIETLLMSCRVLGRGVERAVFAALGDVAKAHGAGCMTGEYRQTSKNGLVQSLYADHGFVESNPGRWTLQDPSYLAWPAEIERLGL